MPGPRTRNIARSTDACSPQILQRLYTCFCYQRERLSGSKFCARMLHTLLFVLSLFAFSFWGEQRFDMYFPIYLFFKSIVYPSVPGKVSKRAKKRGLPQLGTLGAGNHYAEIQVKCLSELAPVLR